MLRSTFIYLSRLRWAQSLITRLPLSRAGAARFVAGDPLADAMAVTQRLNRRGLNVTLDFLGESVTTADEAARAADE